MALILCIEAGTDVGSVALAKNGTLLSLRESMEEKQHARNLAVYVSEILKEYDLDAKDLDAVAVGKGHIRGCALPFRSLRVSVMEPRFR